MSADRMNPRTEPFCNQSTCSTQPISPVQPLIPSSLHMWNKFQTKENVLPLFYSFSRPLALNYWVSFTIFHKSQWLQSSTAFIVSFFSLKFSLWFDITWCFMVNSYGNMLSLGVWVLKIAASWVVWTCWVLTSPVQILNPYIHFCEHWTLMYKRGNN